MQTIEQRRAARAHDCVAGIAAGDDVDIKAYKAVASSFPAMIRMNGLGQALAFIRSRKGNEYRRVYDHVSAWLGAGQAGVLTSSEDALSELVNGDARTYRQAETETIAFMVWIKRYAEAAALRAECTKEAPE